MLRCLNSIPFVFGVLTLSNLLVILLAYVQFNDITDLSRYWKQSETKTTISATTLSEVERNLGYVGFIHYFKKYVMMGGSVNFVQARNSYDEVMGSLEALQEITTDEKDRVSIITIKNTLREYGENLSILHDQFDDLTLEERGQLVQVDDRAAAKALIHLRSTIIPELQSVHADLDESVDGLIARTLFFAATLVPISILTAIVVIFLMRRLATVSGEMAAIFNITPDAILYFDDHGRILNANKAARTLFQYSKSELLEMSVEDLVESDLRHKHQKLRESFVSAGHPRQILNRDGDIRGVRKDGSFVYININIASRKIQGQIRTVSVIQDLTQHNKLKDEAQTDHLTGLSNRRQFDEQLAKEVRRCASGGKNLTLLIIDLDNFKQINDSFGHAIGDQVLQETAGFFKSNVRPSDTLARWGGDEFTILCPHLSAEEAITFAERIRAGFLELDFCQEHDLSLSIGVATMLSGTDAEEATLLGVADSAVYAAKQAGRNQAVHQICTGAELYRRTAHFYS